MKTYRKPGQQERETISNRPLWLPSQDDNGGRYALIRYQVKCPLELLNEIKRKQSAETGLNKQLARRKLINIKYEEKRNNL